MGTALQRRRTIIMGLAAALIGGIAWSGYVATLPVCFGFLILVIVQADRWAALSVALCYYAGSSWPLVPGANAFLDRKSVV